ncbi:AtpZ/AtpI family protein [Acetobacter sp. TBRC 12305]|uniref:ATP synthase protein I n=1 Tax=Acetobacter garciniae TaxID=2817435 RepID=A0A939HN48_9PROT|nr:AtpZ/AtpI family protein [Acetobacter garciniae]MBO1324734.1 AtpZ/AtpI family protein [Acetobacter garciniae]MBX0344425.1 AtpZ/AtpI family protein [Acetobacter garciniae]
MSKEKDESFDARLKAAERRNGLVTQDTSTSPEADADKPLATLALRAGTEMLSALIVGVAIGWGLDHWLHTRAVFLILFALLGGGAGVLNVWRLVRPTDET